MDGPLGFGIQERLVIITPVISIVKPFNANVASGKYFPVAAACCSAAELASTCAVRLISCGPPGGLNPEAQFLITRPDRNDIEVTGIQPS